MKTNITYTLECLPEDLPIRGNCLASGDNAEDERCALWIESELRKGNDWAWCCAKVTCTIEAMGETFAGTDYLGACSYMGEEDFRTPGGYFDDMKRAAHEAALDAMRAALQRAKIAEHLIQREGE